MWSRTVCGKRTIGLHKALAQMSNNMHAPTTLLISPPHNLADIYILVVIHGTPDAKRGQRKRRLRFTKCGLCCHQAKINDKLVRRRLFLCCISLYSAVLCCISLYSAVLCRISLDSAVLCCITLYSAVLCCISLHSAVLCRSISLYSAVLCCTRY